MGKLTPIDFAFLATETIDSLIRERSVCFTVREMLRGFHSSPLRRGRLGGGFQSMAMSALTICCAELFTPPLNLPLAKGETFGPMGNQATLQTRNLT